MTTDMKMTNSIKRMPIPVKKFPFFHPFSRRLHTALLCMIGFCCTTFMRMHLAITMTCMINSTALVIENSHPSFSTLNESFLDEIESSPDHACAAKNSHSKIITDYGGQLVWTTSEQNLIFSGTFWGSLITVLPSMFFINRYSARYVLQAAVGIYIAMTVLTPYLAINFGPIPVFISRFIMGLGEGFILPANNAIIANWFPSAERSTAISLFTTGNQMAGAFGNPVAAYLCRSTFGWMSIFYFASIISTIWSFVWFLTANNQPSKCKLMTQTEREYLDANVVRRSNRTQKSQYVPYVKILTSAPFWAQLLCQFTINSIVTLFQIYLPSYFKDVLHLGVMQNGTYTSIPNVVNFAVKLIWGISIDNLKEKNKISPTFAVKLSQAIANYGGAICLVLIALLVDCTNPALGFALFCFMYGCMGTFVSGFYTSLLSLAPRYTATMSSISVFCAMLGRLSTPAIVGLIKKEGNLSEWQTLFFVLAGANVICGTVFLMFGSGDLQEWGIEEETKQSEMQPMSAKQSLIAVNITAPSIGNIAEQQAESVHFINTIGEGGEDEMVVPQILLNEITLTTEEAERFKRRIREDSMCL